jgi:hypothetical protein
MVTLLTSDCSASNQHLYLFATSGAPVKVPAFSTIESGWAITEKYLLWQVTTTRFPLLAMCSNCKLVMLFFCAGGLFFAKRQQIHNSCSKEEKSPMTVERVNCGNLAINSLPDGSRIIRNSDDNTVLALNPTAAAAWDACASATTISNVAESMRHSFDANVTNELAEASILELQDKKLVTTSGSAFKATRRQILAGLGAVALPLVVSLTVGEQKAHAQQAGSFDHKDFSRPKANVPKNHKRPF